MLRLINKLLLTALTLLVVAAYIPGIEIDGFYPAIIAAITIGLLNLFVRPVLFILTLPITVITLGLFMIIINAALFWFAASFIEGFAVASFLHALLGSLIVSVVSAVGNKYL
ncbi:MAG: phage holin family protein [Candidatus Nomurabacteria bacterium]|nr:phage holin family protein [Candidatus Nomurabacteria bacterium]USN88118.1 MAG: phage holin family protein [Candidatus Nomurabacteria bacterium]